MVADRTHLNGWLALEIVFVHWDSLVERDAGSVGEGGSRHNGDK